jgi:hypothetical protein
MRNSAKRDSGKKWSLENEKFNKSNKKINGKYQW